LGHVGVTRTQRLFSDRQRAFEEPLRLHVVSLVSIHEGQIVEGRRSEYVGSWACSTITAPRIQPPSEQPLRCTRWPVCNGAHLLAARVNSLNFWTEKASPWSGAFLKTPQSEDRSRLPGRMNSTRSGLYRRLRLGCRGAFFRFLQ